MAYYNSLKRCRNLTLAALILILGNGCNKSCSKNNAVEAKVQNCSIYNNDKALCNAAVQLSGEKCKYDDTTALCAVEVIENLAACADMSPEDCQKNSPRCSYDETTAKCIQPPPPVPEQK